MNTEEKLRKILQTKSSLKDAINNKGGTITDDTPFDEYPTQIDNISAAGGGIIEVDELPTENVQTDVLYKVNKVTDIDVYCSEGEGAYNIKMVMANMNPNCNLVYYLVEEQPTNPEISDFATFSQLHIYIINDIPYFYGNLGYGNMWLPVSTVFTQLTSIELQDKGYVYSVEDCVEAGIYVTYRKSTYGIATDKQKLKDYNGGWIDYKSIFDKTITTFETNNNMLSIPNYAFAGCLFLTSVRIGNSVKIIGKSAFDGCASLTTIAIPDSVTSIGWSAFNKCRLLKSIIIPKSLTEIGYAVFSNCDSLTDIYYKGTEEEWNAIDGVDILYLPSNATIHFNYQG